MPYRVTSFEATPNPNALKCLVEPSPATSPRSYFNAGQAADDPLALALFDIEGVTNVLIHRSFITVSKAPAFKWAPIRRAVEKTLAGQG